MKSKLTSRKFITAVTGIVTGILLIAGGNVTEGTTTVVSSILVYCLAEGYIDAKRFSESLKNYGETEGEQK